MRKGVILFVLTSLGLLYGCGGGGGGGGGSSDYGVRLMHASLDDAPLVLKTSLDEAKILQSARFAETKLFTGLPGGTQTLSVEGGQDGRTVSEAFTSQGKEKRSALFYREVSTDAPRLKIINHVIPSLSTTESAISFVHAAAGASILVINVAGRSGETEVVYGNATDYIVVPAGAVSYVVRRQVDGRVLLSEERVLQGGKAYSVLASGQVSFLVFSTLFED